MFEVKKDIPIPKPGGGRPRKYPWPTMEVGDCFELSTPEEFKRAHSAAQDIHKRNEYGQFVFRKVKDVAGVYGRCWRIK